LLHRPRFFDLRMIPPVLTIKSMTPSERLTPMKVSRRTAVFATCALVVAVGVFFFIHYWPKRSEVRSVPAAATRKASPPCITVEAAYPGADAKTLIDAVAAPIEQQVNGVDGMLSMTSQCTNDGVYTLRVTFKKDVNLDVAQELVQNRVAWAMTQLPQIVQLQGLNVKKAPSSVLIFVSLSSPDNRYDEIYLSNYATVQFQDELRRMSGVADTTILGQRDSGFLIQFDSQKLAAHALTVDEATNAIAEQNLQVSRKLGQLPVPPELKTTVSPGPNGAGFAFNVNNLGRLMDPSDLGNVIVKLFKGAPVRLKDVARVEHAKNATETYCRLDGASVVILPISLMPSVSAGETQKAVMERLRTISSRLPQGIALNVPFDFTANLESTDSPARSEYLRLDVVLPFSSSIERTQTVAKGCEALLREVAGVEHVLTLCGRPYTYRANEACMLVALTPDAGRKASRGQIMFTVRTRLDNEMKDAAVFLSDLSGTCNFPKANYPIDLAIIGHELSEAGIVAEKLAERLRQTGKVTDVRIRTSERIPTLKVDIDRAKASAAGVSIADIFEALNALGSGTNWATNADVLGKLKDSKVRNFQDQPIALKNLVQVRETNGVAVLERFDQFPMASITANLAPDVTKEEGREICQQTALELLPNGCRLEWLDNN